jgi:hypothetical protein
MQRQCRVKKVRIGRPFITLQDTPEPSALFSPPMADDQMAVPVTIFLLMGFSLYFHTMSRPHTGYVQWAG